MSETREIKEEKIVEKSPRAWSIQQRRIMETIMEIFVEEQLTAKESLSVLNEIHVAINKSIDAAWEQPVTCGILNWRERSKS